MRKERPSWKRVLVSKGRRQEQHKKPPTYLANLNQKALFSFHSQTAFLLANCKPAKFCVSNHISEIPSFLIPAIQVLS